jgi:hypothetical protein
LLSLAFFVGASSAKADYLNVNVVPAGYTGLQIYWDGVAGKTYRVKVIEFASGDLKLDEKIDMYYSGLQIDGNLWNIGASGLQCATVYEVKVKRTGIRGWRSRVVATNFCAPPPPPSGDPCPAGGWFDTKNCLMGTAPAGTSAFLYTINGVQKYYYTDLPGDSCPYLPYPESRHDDANCFVTNVPAGVSPFIYNGVAMYYSAYPY